jgi:hypothetical protein
VETISKSPSVRAAAAPKEAASGGKAAEQSFGFADSADKSILPSSYISSEPFPVKLSDSNRCRVRNNVQCRVRNCLQLNGKHVVNFDHLVVFRNLHGKPTVKSFKLVLFQGDRRN